jgi:hypothetical protein
MLPAHAHTHARTECAVGDWPTFGGFTMYFFNAPIHMSRSPIDSHLTNKDCGSVLLVPVPASHARAPRAQLTCGARLHVLVASCQMFFVYAHVTMCALERWRRLHKRRERTRTQRTRCEHVKGDVDEVMTLVCRIVLSVVILSVRRCVRQVRHAMRTTASSVCAARRRRECRRDMTNRCYSRREQSVLFTNERAR